MRKRSWLIDSTTRTIATTFCVCCSSAVIRTCPQPSRSQSRCGSFPVCPWRKSPAHFWSARARWSNESRVRSASSPKRTFRSRRRARRQREERLGAVAAMIYLLFNEGYSASGGAAHIRAPLCEEAIRLARLLLRLFPAEPEIMGLDGVDAASACPCAGASRRGRERRAARRSGSLALESRADRGGTGAGGEGVASSTSGSVSGSGRDRRACIRRRRGPRIQTGRKSTGSTRCWRRCSLRRS